MENDKAISLVQDAIKLHLSMGPISYSLDSTYREMGADSLDVVEICMKIEERLNSKCPYCGVNHKPEIELKYAKLGDGATVADLVALVESVLDVNISNSI